ncbi:MAG TPA: ABC transporter permease, partial [Sphingobacteriaceae bacterium]
AWIVTLIIAAFVPVLMVLVFDADSPEDRKLLQKDGLNTFFAHAGMMLNFVFYPMFIVLICTLLAQIEYRNNSWKQVLSSPQPLWQIYMAKFLTVQTLMVTFLTVTLLLVAVSATAVNILHPAFGLFRFELDIAGLTSYAGKTYLSVLALSAVQFWLALRFKSFFVPVGLGFLLWLAGAYLTFEFRKGIYADEFPYAFPLLAAAKSRAHLMPSVLISSVAYTFGVLVLGLANLSVRRIRG